MNIENKLKELTNHVRETKGSGEALRFYVEHIQPLKHYFKNAESNNALCTLLPNVAPIDRTKFNKQDNKYIDCALFLCGYLRVENCNQKRGVVSSELQFIANAIKWQLEGVNCENINIDDQIHK